MKPRILFACLLICVGIAVVSYPWLRAWFLERQIDRAMEQWLRAGHPEALEDNGGGEKTEDSFFSDEEDIFQPYDPTYIMNNMEGILSIADISLRTPILSKYSTYALNLAICRLNGSSSAGEYGNYCLAGHKSRIYGRHFNRLKEAPIGCGIAVETVQAVYHYSVTEAFAVTAEDIWVLEDDLEKKQITLITCDYDQQPTGRFIVRGELVYEEVLP